MQDFTGRGPGHFIFCDENNFLGAFVTCHLVSAARHDRLVSNFIFAHFFGYYDGDDFFAPFIIRHSDDGTIKDAFVGADNFFNFARR